MFKTLALFSSLVAAVSAGAQTNVLYEDFEDSTVTYVLSSDEVSDGAYDFFGRVASDGISVGGNVEYAGVQGGGYFAAMDMDAEGVTLPATLTWTNLNIIGIENLSFSALVAEDDDGANQDWDSADYVHIDCSIDGGEWQNLLWLENDGTQYNSAPFVDTDFDGVGDGSEVTATFSAFTADIEGTGTTLDLRITFQTDAGDEDIAFDNVILSGTEYGFVYVAAPAGFTAVSAGDDQVNLSWTLNDASNAVVVARSTNEIFGTPATGTAYGDGDRIAGGGTVVYTGNGFGTGRRI